PELDLLNRLVDLAAIPISRTSFRLLTSYFSNALLSRTAMKRLLWLDVAKGLTILVVVYFHFFRTYFEHGILPPADWHSFAASVATIFKYIWVKLSGLGFHAVGVFIILSGWALMQSTASRAATGLVSCAALCGARFLSVYPL